MTNTFAPDAVKRAADLIRALQEIIDASVTMAEQTWNGEIDLTRSEIVLRHLTSELAAIEAELTNIIRPRRPGRRQAPRQPRASPAHAAAGRR